jgi:ureidoglycolate dehydrogenase (NAD+)
LAQSAVVCDAARAAGPVAMIMALNALRDLAPQVGIAFASIKETTHTGALGYYVEKLAEQGLIGIAMAAGPVNMAYYGAAAPGLSTSPLAIAVPSDEGPVVFDMATAALSLGRLRGMASRGESLAPDLALDADGRPTTQAADAVTPLPMAGPKGAGLAFMIECLTSILAGLPIAAPIHRGAPRRHVQNGFLLALPVSLIQRETPFPSDVTALANALRDLPRIDQDVPIRIPGDRGRAAYTRQIAAGISLAAGTREEIAAIARERGLDTSALDT